MVTLAKIRPALFTNLYEALLIDDDPLSGEQEWRDVFDYQWDTEEDYCGYALLDEGEVVGMIGMVFSERRIEGTVRKFCNLHTWWTREDHRGRSLALLRPILRLKGYTITYFTPCDTGRAITKRLGFETLSTQVRVLLPRGGVRRKHAPEEADVTYDEQIIEAKLTEHDRKILVDHRPYGCGHLLVGDGDERCYVLFTYVVRHWFPYCHIHYISNKDVFAKREAVIRSSLLHRHEAKFVAVDDRLTPGMTFRSSFKAWAPGPALYRSSDVGPGQIDNLYSDVVMLKLSVLPSLRSQLKRLTRAISPAHQLRRRRPLSDTGR